MRVIRADHMGMCFGVRDALDAMGGVANPANVTVHGELVHNEVVLDDLRARGFRSVPETDREVLPTTSLVLITAHGVSDRERGRLTQAGKALIDTTCPLVRRAHDAAIALRDEGRHVVVIGKRGHVEVRGLVGDLPDHTIIESVDEVVDFDRPRLGVVSQTTAPVPFVAQVIDAIRSRNPGTDVRTIDTVCLPTKDHQRSLERLIDRVDAVVVVGGRNSNNTRALAERSHERGRACVHVQDESDLDPTWFQPDWTVGLTAGTSTLAETIQAVHEALLRIAEEHHLEVSRS